MAFIGIFFLILYILFFFWGKFFDGEKPVITVFGRVLYSLFFSFILTLVLGLPVLGILYLVSTIS